jgi:hypothetical protein
MARHAHALQHQLFEKSCSCNQHYFALTACRGSDNTYSSFSVRPKDSYQLCSVATARSIPYLRPGPAPGSMVSTSQGCNIQALSGSPAELSAMGSTLSQMPAYEFWQYQRSLLHIHVPSLQAMPLQHLIHISAGGLLSHGGWQRSLLSPPFGKGACARVLQTVHWIAF